VPVFADHGRVYFSVLLDKAIDGRCDLRHTEEAGVNPAADSDRWLEEGKQKFDDTWDSLLKSSPTS
jgi:hypothetical protein